MSWDEKITGLLESPMFNAGLGLLEAGAPRIGPNTFGMGLANAARNVSAAEDLRLKNDFMREQLTARKRRNNAVNELQGLLSVPTGTTGVLMPESTPGTPEYKAKMTGLLAEINPEAAVSGLLASEKPRMSTDIATMQALGIPTTAEGFAQYQAMKRTQDPGQQLEMQQLQLEVTRMLDEMESERRERGEQVKIGEINTKSMLKEGLNMFKALDELEGTALESGVGAEEFRAAMASGVDSALALFNQKPAFGAKIRDQFDIFKKASIRFATAMAGEGATDSALSNALSASPNLSMTAGANRQVLASIMSDELDKATALDYDLGDISKYQDYIQRYSGGTPRELGVPVGVDPEVWAAMTPDEKALWR